MDFDVLVSAGAGVAEHVGVDVHPAGLFTVAPEIRERKTFETTYFKLARIFIEFIEFR